MTQAVFILGWGRSGTTWLSNLAALHPGIAAVIEPDRGVFESAYFSEVSGRYGNLDEITNFIELCAVLAQSAYFRLAGVTMEQMVRRYPADYGALFKQLMDEFAHEQSCRTWLEKTPSHTLHAGQISEAIPGARFISIERDARDVIRSQMARLETSRRAGDVKFGRIGLAFKTAQWILTRQHYSNRIDRVQRTSPAQLLRLRYEDLLRDTESEMKRVCSFLDLEFEPVMVSSPYRPNSVFARRDSIRKEDLPGWPFGAWFGFWNGLAKAMPAGLLTMFFRSGQWLENGFRRRSLSFFFFRGAKGAPDWMNDRKW